MRKAIAYAIPYEDIFQTAAYGRGARLWGGKDSIDTIDWPRKSPYSTDMEKAKALLDQSAFAKGFSVPFSISLGLADWMEPTALLIQENLKKLGITTELKKFLVLTGGQPFWLKNACRSTLKTLVAGSIRLIITSSGPTKRVTCSILPTI